MSTLITTSRKPDDFGRRIARILSHIIPDSKRINRGRHSFQTLFDTAESMGYDRVIIVRTKFGHSAILDFYKLGEGGTYEKEELMLYFWDVIDHKIYGWNRIPGGAPISTSKQVEEVDKEVALALQDKLGIVCDRVTSIGLLMDRDEDTTYITLVETKSKKPFFYAKVKIVR